MADRDRNDTGRFTEEYSADDFLDAVRELQPATSTEVAEEVGCARQNADYRLSRLEEEGKVRSKKAGPSTIWMLADE